MEIASTSYTVTQYCRGMQRNEIVVDETYQRSGKVWPPAARSFFIETIFLGFPIPKLTLSQHTDLRSRETVYEIVDGQQRSMAILDYFNDEFRLSRSLDLEEVQGKAFSELDDEYQHRFLDYSFSADLFRAATPREIREMFRRINSYTVPLNAEEQRHAVFQGSFKWFIYRLSRFCETPFLDMGILKNNQVVRMQDTKLLAEICHALFIGIRTTNRKMLDNLYENYEDEFPEAEYTANRIERALSRLVSLEELWNGPLMRPYLVYSLMLAIIHLEKPLPTLASVYQPTQPYKFEHDIVVSNLLTLAEALEAPEELFDDSSSVEEEPESEEEGEGEGEEEPELQEDLAQEELRRFRSFVNASSERTNVRVQRETRFQWMCKALECKFL